MHPSLKFDLLGAQIEACKKRGIATPVYLSVRVDQHIGLTRPDLICRLEDGKLWGPKRARGVVVSGLPEQRRVCGLSGGADGRGVREL